VEPVFWIAMLSNAATLGIAAAVFIPLSRAAARRLQAPAATADRIQALEAELEATQARLGLTEEKLIFMERLLESGRPQGTLPSAQSASTARESERSVGELGHDGSP
jgi:hypothetical protein